MTIASRIFCFRCCITCRDLYLPVSVCTDQQRLNRRSERRPLNLIVISALPPNACQSTLKNEVNNHDCSRIFCRWGLSFERKLCLPLFLSIAAQLTCLTNCYKFNTNRCTRESKCQFLVLII